MKALKILSVICLINNVFGTHYPRVGPTVRTEQGLVRAYWSETDDYYTFAEVPYGTVDLNDPFGSAKPYPSFGEKVFNGYDGQLKQCHQTNYPKGMYYGMNATLDCLRLNIFVPSKARSESPVPVLVWFHGGSFEHGYAFQYLPSGLVRQQIIVVLVNFRLGPYGFMCLDTPLVPGNQGLKDQYQAIKWVKNNIAAFGGNPNEITIAGQGTGACSVLLHLYSPREKIFKRVIAQSGTPQSEGMFVQPYHNAAIKLAEHLGYKTSDTEQALKFLAKKSPESVVEATEQLQLDLRACQEKHFDDVDNLITDSAFSLSNKKKVKGTPIMIGHTDKEAQILKRSEDYYNSDPLYQKIKHNFNISDNELARAVKAVKLMYSVEVPDAGQKKNAIFIGAFESDFVFYHPVQRTITDLIHQGAEPIFEYVFSFKPGHSSELPFLFEMCYDLWPHLNSMTSCNDNSSKDKDDKLVNKYMVTLWANFVKYGNPTPNKTKDIPVIWEPVTMNNRHYLDINKELTMKGRYSDERMDFWDQFWSKFGDKAVSARSF